MSAEKKTTSEKGKGSGSVRVVQVRSAAGRDKRTKGVLNALGLGRIGKSSTLPVNPAVDGMLRRVEHLIEVKVN